MSYRPICDMWLPEPEQAPELSDLWILTRAKLKDGRKYYGAYPGGFPERARRLLGVTLQDSVLHVCGGLAKYYPYKGGYGPNDATLDLAPETDPTYLQDAREPFPCTCYNSVRFRTHDPSPQCSWPAILMDPPYSEEDAERYSPGSSAYPAPNLLLRNALKAVRPGGRIGLLHYILPQPPQGVIFVAAVGVLTGYNNRIRVFSVFERPYEETYVKPQVTNKPVIKLPTLPRRK
jgi:hypothetical protein